MSNYRLDLAYDGTRFRGYARQPGVRTVQGELEGALQRLLGTVQTTVAGRTDAGVHARGQVVSFSWGDRLDGHRVADGLNAFLAPEVSVLGLSEVDQDFDARFSARSRTYRYHILNRRAPDPFRNRFSWQVKTPLDLGAMERAASHFVGEHDFASFCRASDGRSTVRRVMRALWWREDDLLAFEVRASSFCHQMVRSLVAATVETGRGRIPAGDMPGILAARDRRAARGSAPARGLFLWSVEY